jgi:hypothetical protein
VSALVKKHAWSTHNAIRSIVFTRETGRLLPTVMWCQIRHTVADCQQIFKTQKTVTWCILNEAALTTYKKYPVPIKLCIPNWMSITVLDMYAQHLVVYNYVGHVCPACTSTPSRVNHTQNSVKFLKKWTNNKIIFMSEYTTDLKKKNGFFMWMEQNRTLHSR